MKYEVTARYKGWDLVSYSYSMQMSQVLLTLPKPGLIKQALNDV